MSLKMSLVVKTPAKKQKTTQHEIPAVPLTMAASRSSVDSSSRSGSISEWAKDAEFTDATTPENDSPELVIHSPKPKLKIT